MRASSGRRHRLEVGHDGEALGLGLRERRGARARQQPAGRPLCHRVGGEREPAGHLAEHHAAPALRVVLAQAREGLHHLALGDLAGLGEALHGDRLRGEEQERLDDPRPTLAHSVAALTVIGPKGTSCSHLASPAL